MSQPKRKYPILVFGINVKRWESMAEDSGRDAVMDDGMIQFWIDRSDIKLGPSELQKYSRFSIALTYPLCFKFSWYWKFQTPGKPGSELGLFLRIAKWRVDYATNKYEGPGSYYIGLHDD